MARMKRPKRSRRDHAFRADGELTASGKRRSKGEKTLLHAHARAGPRGWGSSPRKQYDLSIRLLESLLEPAAARPSQYDPLLLQEKSCALPRRDLRPSSRLASPHIPLVVFKTFHEPHRHCRRQPRATHGLSCPFLLPITPSHQVLNTRQSRIPPSRLDF